MRRIILALPAVLALAACAYTPPPVPVAGAPAQVAALAGEWAGEYQADDPRGRSGSITLRLSAGRDTAYGEVTMVVPRPAASAEQLPPGAHLRPVLPEARPLTIRFVRAEDGAVSGTLEPYADPDCGCSLRTTFTGRLAGDVIEGTYSSLHVDTGHVTGGRWRVARPR